MKLIHKLMSSMLLATVLVSGCSNTKVATSATDEMDANIYSAEYAGAREEGTSRDEVGDKYYSIDYVKKYQFPRITAEDLKEAETDIETELSKGSKDITTDELSTDIATTVLNYTTELIVKAGQDPSDYRLASIYSLDTMCQVKVSNDSLMYNVCGLIPEAGSDTVQLVYTVQQYVIE